MTQHKALGRSLDTFEGKGLDAFFNSPTITGSAATSGLQYIGIDKISVNRHQPRTEFHDDTLADLANSIAKEGVLQPLVVSPSGGRSEGGLQSGSEEVLGGESQSGRYELIAGERRLRAARMAGLTEVPVVIRTADETKMLELALVENIQREDLNAIDEARGYQALLDQFQLTQGDVAERVGKSREHVANAIRLLKLPKSIQEDVGRGRLSAGHARTLLSLPTAQDQINLRDRILGETLTVRDVEQMIQLWSGVARKKISSRKRIHLSPEIKLLLDRLQESLGTKIHLQFLGLEGRGRLVIEFFSAQDLDRVARKIAG